MEVTKMTHTQHYIPNDLGYSANGYPMEREKFDAMVTKIFENGTVSTVHVHGYSQFIPGEEQKNYFEFSKAIIVTVTQPIAIRYTVHFRGLTPIEIIEEI